MSDFDILLAKLKSGGNLGRRARNPPTCVLCTSNKAINEYEAVYNKTNKFVIEDPSKIKGLVVMAVKNKLIHKCPDCGGERVNDKYTYNTAVWWVQCGKCNNRSLSLIEDKCPICDKDSKEALDNFLREG